MQTKVELAKGGTRIIFHRTATAAWTHKPGEKYRYRTRTRDKDGRNVWAWREMRCECEVSEIQEDRAVISARSSRPATAAGA